MIIFPALLLTAIVIFAIDEFTSRAVYGPFVKEEELDEYFPKKWEEYRAHGASDRLIFGQGTLPYLSRSRGVLWAWYIDDIGRIPRWSKWGKKLDELYAEMRPVKKLSDY